MTKTKYWYEVKYRPSKDAEVVSETIVAETYEDAKHHVQRIYSGVRGFKFMDATRKGHFNGLALNEHLSSSGDTKGVWTGNQYK